MDSFTLNTSNAEAWRRSIQAGRTTPHLANLAGATLPGLLELFATAIAHRDTDPLLTEILSTNSHRNQMWHHIVSAWRQSSSHVRGVDIHGTRVLEFFRLRTATDQTGDEFYLFQQRFRRSIESNGFSKPFAYALAKVLAEMTDNVVQHSADADAALTGLAGYHAEAGYAAFGVVDIGRGILARLRDSPQWKHLSSPRNALHAIVEEGASSRYGQGPGEGFKQLFKSLIDRNGIIRLRTDDWALLMADAGNQREAREMRSPHLAGVQVSAAFAVDGRISEREIRFHLLQ